MDVSKGRGKEVKEGGSQGHMPSIMCCRSDVTYCKRVA